MKQIVFSDVGLLLQADALDGLRALPDACAQVCVTSPPYFGLRDYGVKGQMGLEGSVSEYLAVLVNVFREVARVLRPDGTVWLNMGDSYAADSGPQPPTGTRNKQGHTSRRVPKGFKNKDLRIVCIDGWMRIKWFHQFDRFFDPLFFHPKVFILFLCQRIF